MNCKLAGITILVTISARGAIAGTTDQRVVVCSRAVSDFDLIQGRMVAKNIFAEIGVALELKTKQCPAEAIRIQWSMDTDPKDHRGALAYALPYQGIKIVVFVDRVRHMNEPQVRGIVLGHVLAHVIGHILQGVVWHSDAGVMKAVFTKEDTGQMAHRPLSFLPDDEKLIHAGIERRANRLMAAAPAAVDQSR